MFGFRDYTFDPRTGRPQPHQSWLVERVTTWTACGMALAFGAAAACDYAKWGDPDTALRLLGGAVLIGLIACIRQVALQRKRQALRAATQHYEAALADLAQTLPDQLP